ncbi:MAG TPA: hypothetical protein VLW65_24200, partial [Bryobacteraceae bacterium]|nr:hypothetical protein [Bryobacteraceae bacterium]
TRDLLDMADWLRAWGVTHVAMESTGVYWKPVWHYLSALFRRTAARRGVKRAIIAVAHALLIVAYNLFKRPVEYRELGADYLGRLHPERLKRRLVKRLEALGHKVLLEPAAQTNLSGSFSNSACRRDHPHHGGNSKPACVFVWGLPTDPDVVYSH